MTPTVVLDVVGLTRRMLGEHTPNLSRLAKGGGACPIDTITPAVTCSVQSTFLTGTLPREHGCVGNGWYFRDLSEVWLWRQSARLIGGERVWDVARRLDPSFTVATLFWWYAMYNGADWTVTPRPLYPADGRKIPDIYTDPVELRAELTARLGAFPLFNFWGPKADIRSSRWIAAAARHVFDTRHPTLTLAYLPHLDYDLQRFGPSDPRIAASLREIDAVCGELIEHVQARGARVLVCSEYGITDVSAPVHINRALRSARLLAVRDELGTEKLDAGASIAFAVADHQIAHVYVRDRARIAEVRQLLESLDGVQSVLDAEGQRAIGLDHPRSGELVAISRADRWFTYYHWLDDDRAPDYARTVDIHRKPGYDPCELFVDPALRMPAVRVAWTLAKKAIGQRYLMEVIPLDAGIVRGSHGRVTDDPLDGPVAISSDATLLPSTLSAVELKDTMLQHVFGAEVRSREPLAATGT